MKFLCPNCKSERIGKSISNSNNYSYNQVTEYPSTDYLLMDVQQHDNLLLSCLICKHIFPSNQLVKVEANAVPEKLDETVVTHLKYLLQNDKMKAVTYCKNVLEFSLAESVNIIQKIHNL